MDGHAFSGLGAGVAVCSQRGDTRASGTFRFLRVIRAGVVSAFTFVTRFAQLEKWNGGGRSVSPAGGVPHCEHLTAADEERRGGACVRRALAAQEAEHEKEVTATQWTQKTSGISK